MSKQTCIPINSIELIDLNRFMFSAKLIDLIQFLFQVSWLVIESICFHNVGDWVDWLWNTKLKIFQEKVNKILSWMIYLIELFDNSCEFVEPVHTYLVTWLNWLNIFKLYRFMVIESIHFHILSRLNWLFWYESYTSMGPKYCRIRK